jgi:hypothetical protein
MRLAARLGSVFLPFVFRGHHLVEEVLMNAVAKIWLLVVFILSALNVSTACHALLLNGSGPATQLTGTLGTVDAVSVDDSPLLAGYLGSTGLEDLEPPIDITRVQYDLLNNAGNGSIFEFRVTFPVGTNVIGAGNPRGFIDSSGVVQDYWEGSNFTILFDNGFGVYNYDQAFGSEWRIVYGPDHVTWQHLGNGFFADTATGRTDLGNVIPTFRLSFAPDTPLGMRPAQVTGFLTGLPVIATGMVLSAVPEPGSMVLVALGAMGIVTWCRRVRHDSRR